MGTNYYLIRNICGSCGRGDERMHIGKSSAGWCFSLHVEHEDHPRDLAEWRQAWCEPHSEIRDEYGKLVAMDEMDRIITERSWKPRTDGYDSAEWYRSNHAEPGPQHLARHTLDSRHCIGHGDGTYDLIVGEFS